MRYASSPYCSCWCRCKCIMCNSVSSVFIRSIQDENIASFSFQCRKRHRYSSPGLKHPPPPTTTHPPPTHHLPLCTRRDTDKHSANVLIQTAAQQRCQAQKIYDLCAKISPLNCTHSLCFFFFFLPQVFIDSSSSVCASMLQFHRDWLCNRNRVQRRRGRAGGELASVSSVEG